MSTYEEAMRVYRGPPLQALSLFPSFIDQARNGATDLAQHHKLWRYRLGILITVKDLVTVRPSVSNEASLIGQAPLQHTCFWIDCALGLVGLDGRVERDKYQAGNVHHILLFASEVTVDRDAGPSFSDKSNKVIAPRFAIDISLSSEIAVLLRLAYFQNLNCDIV